MFFRVMEKIREPLVPLQIASQALGKADSVRKERRPFMARRGTVRKLLNKALATDVVCVLRYKRHYFSAAIPSAWKAGRSRIGEREPTTRRLLEEILAVEEEHADDLSRFPGRQLTRGGPPGRGAGAGFNGRPRPGRRPRDRIRRRR
ncbi:hypothetical protein [Achromobacter sp. DMS1]|uniref:hypothetical protein n=1 Tax=Achromobacter sp. DMS1 TaxID=1688405 RepID=UPI0035109E69